jgi:hypothetical protein
MNSVTKARTVNGCRLEWSGQEGRQFAARAELLAVSEGCIALRGKFPLILGNEVVIRHVQTECRGRVYSCFFRRNAYYLGIEVRQANGTVHQ